MSHVDLHRAHTDEQCLSDFSVGQTLAKEIQDLFLSRRKLAAACRDWCNGDLGAAGQREVFGAFDRFDEKLALLAVLPDPLKQRRICAIGRNQSVYVVAPGSLFEGTSDR